MKSVEELLTNLVDIKYGTRQQVLDFLAELECNSIDIVEKMALTPDWDLINMCIEELSYKLELKE